jgi:hypothetical protein
MKTYFDHKNLELYQQAIGFCGSVGNFPGKVTRKPASEDQLDQVSTSIPLQTAEANGRFSDAGRARFLDPGQRTACLLKRFSTRVDFLPEDESEYDHDQEHDHEGHAAC